MKQALVDTLMFVASVGPAAMVLGFGSALRRR